MTEIYLGNPPEHIKNWIIEHSKPQCDALCFTAKADQSMLRLSQSGNPDIINLQTSFDGKSWTPYNVGDVITINSGEKVYFKAVGQNNRMATSPENYHKFDFIGEFEASGNVNSLLEEDEETARTMSLANRDLCYAYLFSGAHLTKAPELPATTLAKACYAMMFENCSSLTQAPALPATTLDELCYYTMFSGCSSLTRAPELPADDLINSCYAYMFQGCTSLNYVSAGFYHWEQNATDNWLPENTGTFECPQTLIDNTTDRTQSTVPRTWTMVAV